MQKSKRGQAAMEFLMTYGWAILVVLIAIGALAYFGVLNPGRFLPRSCTLMPGLECSEFKVDSSDAQVQLLLRNGLGDSIDFSSLNIDTNLDGTGDCTAVDPVSISDGALSAQINIAGCTIASVGERFRGNIVGTYTLGTGTLAHSMSGSLVTEVES
ncbi:MAG: hypothetical protein AABY22_36115 [Nanoarchaeota archaeon]